MPPFVKIMQSFILMQNTYKKDWIGSSEIFGAFFFFQEGPFLANIGHCPNI